jgi:hypothetical protein
VASDINQELRVVVPGVPITVCEYCLIHEDDVGFPHQIDHVVSGKHGGLSGVENLAYAWILCNRHKGSDVASIDPFNWNCGSVIQSTARSLVGPPSRR